MCLVDSQSTGVQECTRSSLSLASFSVLLLVPLSVLVLFFSSLILFMSTHASETQTSNHATHGAIIDITGEPTNLVMGKYNIVCNFTRETRQGTSHFTASQQKYTAANPTVDKAHGQQQESHLGCGAEWAQRRAEACQQLLLA